MENYDGLVKKYVVKYGCIRLKLAKILDEREITRNRLMELVGSRYDVINRYYQGKNIQMVDLDLMARICCVLHCDISDLLEYVPEEKA